MQKSITYSDDYMSNLGIAINSMLSDDAVGHAYVIKNVDSKLHMESVSYDSLLKLIDEHHIYEIIIFDGGNIHGDLWKSTFYPKTGVSFFINES
jgi:uridylate kinase